MNKYTIKTILGGGDGYRHRPTQVLVIDQNDMPVMSIEFITYAVVHSTTGKPVGGEFATMFWVPGTEICTRATGYEAEDVIRRFLGGLAYNTQR